MCQHLLRLICILAFASSVQAQDAVATWLQHMGCEQLLAAYYEEILEQGSQKEKVDAATELANLYAMLLSRSSDSSHEATLDRAAALLERMPEAGAVDLRIQLLRAGYLTAEQTLEKYRLRFVNKEVADDAIEQLVKITSSFDRLRETFLRKARVSKAANDRNATRLGLVTSLLAWSKYYIAWHLEDQNLAREAALLFASMIQGEQPTLQHVSLDFKAFDYGARAILGIALCKDVSADPEGPLPWLEELQDLATWPAVRVQIPMWAFFLDIDHKNWDKVLTRMHSVEDMDKVLILRLAVVHALEDSKTADAQKVASKGIEALVKLGQLGVVSKIVDSYGFSALPSRSFIAKYIEGDLAYRALRLEFPSEEPARDSNVISQYLNVASILKSAINAPDVKEYQQLVDDCNYILGLSLFHASSFLQAAEAFSKSSDGDSAERATWMAIVSLDHIEPSSETVALKEVLVNRYISSWPNNKRATKLLLHQSQAEAVSKDRLENLLSVSEGDPQYGDAQEQACRLLYKIWQSVSKNERIEVGNQYVFTAVPLMLKGHAQTLTEIEAGRIAARAFRILEVALNPQIARLVAADNAFQVINKMIQSGDYKLGSQESELAYRAVLRDSIVKDNISLVQRVDSMISEYPGDVWTIGAAKSLWNYWAEEGATVASSLKFRIGHQILSPLSDEEISNSEHTGLAVAVVEAGQQIHYSQTNTIVANESLRIAKVLLKAYSQNAQILKLNSFLEHAVGDKSMSLQHWRTIAAGSSRGGLDWLEARFHIISSLAKNKPMEALAVLDQHQILYPSYGSDPFGSQLKKLHHRLKGVRDES